MASPPVATLSATKPCRLSNLSRRPRIAQSSSQMSTRPPLPMPASPVSAETGNKAITANNFRNVTRSSLHRDRPSLLDVRHSLERLLDGVLQQRAHPLLHGDCAQLADGGLVLNGFLHLVGSDEQLVHAHTALVAAVVAVTATLVLRFV